METLLYNRLTAESAGRPGCLQGGRGERSRCSLPGGVMNNVWRQIGCGGLVGWQQGIDDHKGVRRTIHIVGCYVQLESTHNIQLQKLSAFYFSLSIILYSSQVFFIDWFNSSLNPSVAQSHFLSSDLLSLFTHHCSTVAKYYIIFFQGRHIQILCSWAEFWFYKFGTRTLLILEILIRAEPVFSYSPRFNLVVNPSLSITHLYCLELLGPLYTTVRNV